MVPSLRPLLLACAAMLLAGACSPRNEGAPEALVDEALQANARQQAAADQAPRAESTLTLETEAGLYSATTGENLPLPGDFPGDVLLPEDVRITSSTRLGPTMSLGAHSPRSLALVFDEFRQAQRAVGWTEAAVQDDATVRVASFDKADRHLEANFVEEAGGGTTLAVTVGPAPD